MRKILTALSVFLSLFLVFSVSPVSAKVLNDQTGAVVVGKNEIVNDDLFIGAQTVQIEGTVNGDVFVGAQTVKITGVINGNLHIGANTIDLSGTVKGSVYAGAQNILVSAAKVGGSLLLGGATVNIDSGSSVAGSILAGAGSLSINSQVKRSVYAGTGSLVIGSDARIGKDLYYASDESQEGVNISPDAKISGNTYKSEVKTAQNNMNIEAAKKQFPGAMMQARVFTTLLSFLGALIIGFIYLKLFGKHFAGTVSILSESFWKSFGVGFLVSISFIPALIILLITVVGIPVAGVAFLMLLLYSYLAKIVVGSALGTWASQKMNWKMSTYGAFAFGLLIIYIVKMIPLVGFVAGLTVLWSGLGALTLRVFSKDD